MKKLLLLMLTGMLVSAQQHHGNVSWELVEAIRQVESKGRNVVGDHGMAVGQWQFWRIAWKDVNQERAKQGLLTYSYQFAWDEKVARVYAHDLLLISRARFIGSQKREPTIADLWYMYNLGYNRYAIQLGADIDKAPIKTRVRAWKKLMELKKNMEE